MPQVIWKVKRVTCSFIGCKLQTFLIIDIIRDRKTMKKNTTLAAVIVCEAVHLAEII